MALKKEKKKKGSIDSFPSLTSDALKILYFFFVLEKKTKNSFKKMAPLFKLLVVEGEEKKERGAVASSQTNAFDLNRHAFLLTDHLPPKGKKKKKKI